ncbi:MAG: tetratricopeptide repeat protein [Planctomycetota bacterium]
MTTPEPDPARRARDEFAETGVSQSSSAAPGERPGDMIDRYKLLQAIGEGGMGTVWMAEQKEPVRRQVALKIIKLGMDTKEVVVRFEAERQALALMDHPNIAKVLDGGATAQGRPFFVMELVRGVPITQYCDEQKLGIRARLELFTKVCEAIQHAHHKGVIHRDIKPSNVMVTLHDGTPVPKVIDFGIAKATSVELTQKTLFTQYGNMIGTPEYMAPEQAAMSGLDIDTRADVYSLGVLLYELLTGSKPFDLTKVLEKGYQELLRTIREDDPAKPSTRVSTLGDKTPLALSHANVGKLSSRLRGDLDWIVMRALEKDRTRRYETANGFAADVARYLHGEPVHAAPPSSLYKLRKFVARRKRTVALMAVIVVLLIGGSVGTTLGWMEAASANTRLAAEVVEKEWQRELAEGAKTDAQTQQARAEEQEAEARKQAAIAEAVAKFQTDMLAAVDPSQLPLDPVTKEPLKDAVTVVQAMAAAVRVLDEDGLADQPLVEGRVRQAIGSTLRQLGRYDEAEPNLRKALALQRAALPPGHVDIAAGLTELGTLLRARNDLAEAGQLLEEALEIVRAARPAGHPDIAVGLDHVATILEKQNRLAEAEPLFRESLEIRRAALPAGHPNIMFALVNLGLLLLGKNDLAEAEPLLRDALETARAAFPAGHPSVADAASSLARVPLAQGRLAAAEPLFREALEIRRATLPGGHPEIGENLNDLAMVLLQQYRLAEAEPLFRESLEIARASLPAGHPNIARCLSNLATVLQNQNKLAEAEPLFREDVEIRRAGLPAGHPDIAQGLNNLALLLWNRNELGEAEALFREALEIYRAGRPYGHPSIAIGLNNLGLVLRSQNRSAEAEPLFREGLEIARAAFPAGHPNLAACINNLCLVLQDQGKLAEAEPLMREVLEIHRSALPAGHPDIAVGLINLAGLLRDLRRFDEAEGLLREAAAIARASLPAGHPTRFAALDRLLPLLQIQGTPEEELSLRRELMEEHRAMLREDSTELAVQLAGFGANLIRLKAAAEAEAALRKCLAIRVKAEPDVWTTFQTRSLLGDACLGQGKLAEAEPLLLDGYRGMKEREADIPAGDAVLVPEALERLVRLFEAKGDEGEAAVWRSELEAAKSAMAAPAAEAGK